MNNTKKPRKGVSRNSGSNKKTAAKKPRETFFIPRGFPGAGRFTTRDAYTLFYLPEIQERQRQEKLRHDREVRGQTRARRQTLMARPDGVHVTLSELRERLSGWGSTSTGQLREKTRYKWHGVFHVQGGRAVMERAMKLAGSDVKIKKLGSGADLQYEFILTPYYGKYTPTQAETRLPDHAAQMLQQLQGTGATVQSLGAFWRKA